MAFEAAPAKVNLFLHVVGRRADGYHLLDSLIVFAGIGDVVEATAATDWSLEIAGPFGSELRADPDNLVVRAARDWTARHGGTPRRLVLDKRLPVASGIGGGSADAAATLRLLHRAARRADALDDIAAALGADVPVCLHGRAARMGGIGELLTPPPALPAFGIALVNPGVAVSTASVFARRDAAYSRPAALPDGWPTAGAMAANLACMTNDLEEPARRLAPAVAEALAALGGTTGCLLARMSGSGSTCFGLFDDTAAAAAAAAAVTRPGWWCWGGGLAPVPAGFLPAS